MRRLLRKLFGRKYYEGGTITTAQSHGPWLKLHGGEGYTKYRGKLYYWREE